MGDVAIKKAEMPAPDQVVDYGDGRIGPAMFHYATDACDLEHIAQFHGFEIADKFLAYDDAAPRALQELVGSFDYDIDSVALCWKPRMPKPWKLVAVHDTEDGPVAIFLRPREEPETRPQVAQSAVGQE